MDRCSAGRKIYTTCKFKNTSPVDHSPVWSIVCLFIHKDYRKKGISVELIKNACRFAAVKGGTIVDAYPAETKNKTVAPVFIYTGTAFAFKNAEFKEVARQPETSPVIRKDMTN
ncbi:MAG: GNAT family N-acetyltransferase [Ignavibacteriaceae bacterium]